MKKIAIYVRVSSDCQTVENQKLSLIEFAATHHYIYDLFEEVQSTRQTRPVKQELLSKLRQKQYDAVVVYKLDRWARSSAELILDITELLNKGIGFISLTDNLDFSTAAGRLHFQILSAFAEFERSLIRLRTIEGLRRARAQGKIPGRPKGRKDSKKRKRSGYILREAKKRQLMDSVNGTNKHIDFYLN